MRPGAVLIASALVLAACNRHGAAPTGPQPPPLDTPTLQHDFGVIPHGESRAHEFRVDLSALPEPYVPMRVHLDCSCGRAELRNRHADGRERRVDDSGAASNMPGPDEQLFVRVEIDTATKEAIDLAKTTSHGYVLLQAVDETGGARRIKWPLLDLHFGIESPVELRPFAALDLGRVATSQRGEIMTTLRGDERHRDMKFGPITCDDPTLTVALEPAEDHVVVRAHLRSAELGNHRALVKIATSQPGYSIPLVATWKIVPDLEASPMPKVTVQADLARPQREDEIGPQFVNVVDHDPSRSPEFAVQSLVSPDGRDLSNHFAVSFARTESNPRQRRMFVRYTGGLDSSVRGTIVLTKDGSDGPHLPIELVLFAKKPR